MNMNINMNMHMHMHMHMHAHMNMTTQDHGRRGAPRSDHTLDRLSSATARAQA